MTKDKRVAKVCGIYAEMDENKRQKMELLAVSLLNVQIIADSEKSVKKKKQNSVR
jgi:hypothetical protein